MYSLSFNLRDPQSEKEALILLFVSYRGQRIKVSTRQKVHPQLWIGKENRVTKSAHRIKKYMSNASGIQSRLTIVQTRLDDISAEVSQYFHRESMGNNEPDLKQLKAFLKNYLRPVRGDSNMGDSVRHFLTVFISEASSGSRKKVNGANYRKSTIKCYNNLLNALQRFEKDMGTEVTWSKITRAMYSSLIKWHEDQGYSINYTGRHIKELKSIMRVAHEEGIHSNTVYTHRWFSVPKEVIKKIPLSMAELDRMRAMDLNDDYHRCLSRDVFVLGCFIGLRVSDIKRLKRDHIYEDDHGKFIRIKTQKTGMEVEIPLGTAALNILEKYEYQLPYFTEQVVNRHLKDLARRIGLEPVRAKRLSIHYSRATFAKMSYELGIPSMHIMRVTGHTSESSFLRYINVSPGEAVAEFRKHDMFA